MPVDFALLQRKVGDDEARHAAFAFFRMVALPGGQHFGQVELAVRRDRQLRLRRRDADFRQAPGTADDGFPFQLHGQGADGQQRCIVCAGRFLESDLVRFQAQGKRVEAHVGDAGLAREFFFCKFG
ncbi:hypothetical protein D9M70_605770 [compost metagenome]